jgi:hypothetical protein
MKTSEDPITSEILHRLIVPIQTRGNLGKSTEAIARCQWMSERGVSWKGYDLDAFNRTLSNTYPEDVVFCGTRARAGRRAHQDLSALGPKRGHRD